MSFDFPQTCPDINYALRQIEREAKKCLKDQFLKWFEDFYKYSGEMTADEFATNCFGELEDIIAEPYEDIRKLNSDMRDLAESEIESLEEQVSHLDYLKEEIEELEKIIKEQKEEIEMLKGEC